MPTMRAREDAFYRAGAELRRHETELLAAAHALMRSHAHAACMARVGLLPNSISD